MGKPFIYHCRIRDLGQKERRRWAVLFLSVYFVLPLLTLLPVSFPMKDLVYGLVITLIVTLASAVVSYRHGCCLGLALAAGILCFLSALLFGIAGSWQFGLEHALLSVAVGVLTDLLLTTSKTELGKKLNEQRSVYKKNESHFTKREKR